MKGNFSALMLRYLDISDPRMIQHDDTLVQAVVKLRKNSLKTAEPRLADETNLLFYSS